MENKVISDCLDKLNSLRIEKWAYHKFERIVNDILTEINALMRASVNNDEKQKFLGIYGAVSHTLDKEVQFIKFKEDEMKKKNTAKIRFAEHSELVSKAYDMIRLDILSL